MFNSTTDQTPCWVLRTALEQRVDSLEKTLMLRGIGGKRRRGTYVEAKYSLEAIRYRVARRS